MAEPKRCPVCEGRGHVPNGFYGSTAGHGWTTASTLPERCEACKGEGVVWESLLEAVGRG